MPPNPPPPADPPSIGWYWAQDQEACADACGRYGLLCDAIESRVHPLGMAIQDTQADLEARMHEANANSGDTFTWGGNCSSWVAQQWNALPFYQTGNGKCFSSGLNSNGEFG